MGQMEVKKQQVAPHPVLTDYYSSADARRKKVDQMFDDSAEHYGWITDMMSFGSGSWYRKQALGRAGLVSGMKLLDVGAGNGIVSALAQQIVGDDGLVIALDPSKGMLREAKKMGVTHTTQGLGESLPFPDNTFDMVSMGYALRHVADLKAAFSEYLRVLKPGGNILLLEITRPENKIALALMKIYMKGIIPAVTRLFRRSAEAQTLMKYYWDTIENCVPPKTILEAMRDVDVEQAERHVALGIFSEYRGVKAASY